MGNSSQLRQRRVLLGVGGYLLLGCVDTLIYIAVEASYRLTYLGAAEAVGTAFAGDSESGHLVLRQGDIGGDVILEVPVIVVICG